MQRYTVETRGNGYMVKIVRKADGWDCFLQGDDATEFLRGIESVHDDLNDNYCDEYADLFRAPVVNPFDAVSFADNSAYFAEHGKPQTH